MPAPFVTRMVEEGKHHWTIRSAAGTADPAAAAALDLSPGDAQLPPSERRSPGGRSSSSGSPSFPPPDTDRLPPEPRDNYHEKLWRQFAESSPLKRGQLYKSGMTSVFFDWDHSHNKTSSSRGALEKRGWSRIRLTASFMAMTTQRDFCNVLTRQFRSSLRILLGQTREKHSKPAYSQPTKQ